MHGDIRQWGICFIATKMENSCCRLHWSKIPIHKISRKCFQKNELVISVITSGESWPVLAHRALNNSYSVDAFRTFRQFIAPSPHRHVLEDIFSLGLGNSATLEKPVSKLAEVRHVNVVSWELTRPRDRFVYDCAARSADTENINSCAHSANGTAAAVTTRYSSHDGRSQPTFSKKTLILVHFTGAGQLLYTSAKLVHRWHEKKFMSNINIAF